MSLTQHEFNVTVQWPAPDQSHLKPNRGFNRSHTVASAGMPNIKASSAKQFLGHAERWNPELFLTAAVAQCHMLTFLYLANRQGLKITSYTDDAAATLSIDVDGIGGEITDIYLRPNIEVTSDGRTKQAILELIEELTLLVPKYCFIRRSIKSKVHENTSVIITE